MRRRVSTSAIAARDIVATTRPIPLKQGAKALATLPTGTDLRVLEPRGIWLGVAYKRGDEEIRGWVQTRNVAAQRIVLHTRETHVATPLDGIDWASAAASADGKRLAYVVRHEGASQVVVDGKRGAVFDEIEPGQPVMNQDGSRVAYGATRDRQWFVVTDDVVAGPYASLRCGHPVVSSGGSHVLYVAGSEGQQHLIVDGREVVAALEILSDSPLLSPDGRRYAYATRDEGPWHVSVNGRELASFDEVATEDMAFSADAERFACIGRRGASAFVVLDGRQLAHHEAARLPVFLPGNRGICYQAYERGKWSIVIGSRRSAQFDKVGDFVVHEDTNKVAFWACKGASWHVVQGGRTGPAYDDFGRGSLTLGPRGRRLAYVAVRDGKAIVVVDGKESEPYDGVLSGTPTFGPRGQQVAYAALADGTWRLYINDVEQRSFADSLVEFSIRFTPDGILPLSMVSRGDRLALGVGDAVSTVDYYFPRGSRLQPLARNRFSILAGRGNEFLRLEAEVQLKR